jgi:hypothetical protein
LKVNFNENRFLHLLFGTPYASFRERILLEFHRSIGQTNYVLGAKPSPRFDVQTGMIDGAIGVKAGSKLHQMIEVLLRDFYEPVRIAGLFSALFPEEHYNVSSSSSRVRQLISRTRRWLEREKIPVSVVEENSFYSMRIDGRFSFQIPLERNLVDARLLRFEKLKSLFGKVEYFSSRDVHEYLGVSLASAQSLLNWAISEGQVERIGDSKRATVYRIAEALRKSA